MHVSTVVIGAGPAGLAAAYYLQQRQIPFAILEKASVAHAWQNHYDGLRLHTLKEVSALPGRPMPAHYPPFATRQQVVDYLQEYAAHFQFPIHPHTEVLGAQYDTQWHIRTTQGEWTAADLIVATGIWSTPHQPHFAGEADFHGRILHANAYKNAAPFAGQRVLVVGAGNSGTELAVELAEAGAETAILVREGVSFVPYPTSAAAMRTAAWLFRYLPDAWGHWLLARSRPRFDHLGLPWPKRPLPQVYPVVGFELPQAVAAGRVRVYNAGIERFTAEGVRFADGQEAPFETVFMATGYRPTVDFVAPYLDLDARGWPILDHWRSPRQPHLFCIGFTYPNTAGWLQNIGRVAREAVGLVGAA